MKILKNEKGYALIFAILMLALFSILSVGIMATVSANNNIGRNERGLQSAYYISEAGIKTANIEFMDQLVTIHENSNNADEFFTAISNYISTTYSGGNYKTVSGFESAYSSNPVAEVIIKEGTRTGDTREYEIISKGILDGGTRITKMKFSLKWAVLGNPEFAVFTTDGMEINSGTINGPIGTLATASDAINITSWPYLNDVYVPDVSTGITKPDHYDRMGEIKEIGDVTYNTPDFPDKPFPLPNSFTNYTIVSHPVVKDGKVNITHDLANDYILQLLNDEYYLEELNMHNNLTLNIDLNGKDRTLYVKNLNITGGIVNITGDYDGKFKLTLHVIDEMNINNACVINVPPTMDSAIQNKYIGKLNIYYEGNKKVVFDANHRLFGSMYIKKANLAINAGASDPNFGIFGHIICLGDEIKINGGTAASKGLIYAPNAHVELEGGAKLASPTISKTFKMNGGCEITYDPNNPDSEMVESSIGEIFKQGFDNLLDSQTPIREK